MHELLEKFCTPPFMEITNFDLKSAASAEKSCVNILDKEIPVYIWGKGKKVLLVHGWGSRATHLSLLARTASEAGFQVIAFDAPAHSSVSNPLQKTTSMFEFGRIISAVAHHFKEIDTVMAHSFGAITSLFAISGQMRFNGLEFYPNKAVLISSPSGLDSVISSFSRNNNFTENEECILRKELEKDFDFRISDYSINSSFRNIPGEILIIHDKDDEEIPLNEAFEIKKSIPHADMHLTNGMGHKKVLFSREVAQTAVKFISGKL